MYDTYMSDIFVKIFRPPYYWRHGLTLMFASVFLVEPNHFQHNNYDPYHWPIYCVVCSHQSDSSVEKASITLDHVHFENAY